MPATYDRDLIGYGANPPNPKWPGGARLAINFVMNYEEGSEPSVQDGEGFTEVGLTEAHGLGQGVKGRDLAAEGMFEYGSRVGFWRLMRLFQERKLPMTVFGCALALERHKPAADGDPAPRLRRLLPRLALDQALRADRGRRARAHRARPSRRCRRRWASGRSAGIAATGRASTRAGWWSRKAASSTIPTTMATSCRSGNGRRPAAPVVPYSLTNNDGKYAGWVGTLGSVVRLHPRCLRHALQGGRQDAEDDVGRTAHAADRPPRTRRRPGAAARLYCEAGRRLGDASARYRAALDDDAPLSGQGSQRVAAAPSAAAS